MHTVTVVSSVVRAQGIGCAPRWGCITLEAGRRFFVVGLVVSAYGFTAEHVHKSLVWQHVSVPGQVLAADGERRRWIEWLWVIRRGRGRGNGNCGSGAEASRRSEGRRGGTQAQEHGGREVSCASGWACLARAHACEGSCGSRLVGVGVACACAAREAAEICSSGIASAACVCALSGASTWEAAARPRQAQPDAILQHLLERGGSVCFCSRATPAVESGLPAMAALPGRQLHLGWSERQGGAHQNAPRCSRHREAGAPAWAQCLCGRQSGGARTSSGSQRYHGCQGRGSPRRSAREEEKTQVPQEPPPCGWVSDARGSSHSETSWAASQQQLGGRAAPCQASAEAAAGNNLTRSCALVTAGHRPKRSPHEVWPGWARLLSFCDGCKHLWPELAASQGIALDTWGVTTEVAVECSSCFFAESVSSSQIRSIDSVASIIYRKKRDSSEVPEQSDSWLYKSKRWKRVARTQWPWEVGLKVVPRVHLQPFSVAVLAH